MFRVLVKAVVSAFEGIRRVLFRARQPSSDASPPATIKSQSTSPAGLSSQSPAFFALIIGINKYLRVTPLKGAVADSDAVHLYLTEKIGVPDSQIRHLRNEEATRAAILRELQALVVDKRIKKGDPILVYYAGHGAETAAPQGWDTGDSKIQMLVPHDFRSEVDGRVVHGIPDRTIGAILDRLAQAKGDNISLIFDCCHSGSGSRVDEVDPTHLARVVQAPDDLPTRLDMDIWNKPGDVRGSQVPPGFIHTGLRSHVLLAACNSKELAQETQGRGVFTRELLETLIAVGADKVTYTNLLQRMHALPQQNPQCEGVNQNRILFNAKVWGQGRVMYNVRKDGNDLVVEAGTAHGISNGAEFSVHQEPNSPSIGTATIVEAGVYSSKLSIPLNPSFSLAIPAFARQTKAGEEEDLRLYLTPQMKATGVVEELMRDLQNAAKDHVSILLEDKDKADIEIDVDNNEVVFDILSTLVTQYGLTRVPFRVPSTVDHIYPVIRAMAHYNWHLRRQKKRATVSNEGSFLDDVHVEFRKLTLSEYELDEDYNRVIREDGGNLNFGGVVDLVVSEDVMYGIKIINNSDRELYPYLFFFDNSELSITSYYQPPTAGLSKVESPLKPKQSLTIGYGAGGAAPFNYYLRDGQDVDVGFLKLFLTTEPINMSNIPQNSPFSPDSRGEEFAQSKMTSTWDTILITIVQRRYPISRKEL